PMYSRSPYSLSVRCQWKPRDLSDLSAPFYGAGSTASWRLCVRSARRYLDDAKMVRVLRDGDDNRERSPRLRHVDPRNRLAGLFGENLHTGRERIPSGDAGQGAATCV